MSIIARYLSKEVTSTMIAVTLVLLAIFMCNNIVRYLGLIAQGKYAFWVLIHLILLQIPITLGLLLPLGLYIGILMAYGRLYVDSEMTVLSACGFSRASLFKVNLSLAAVIALISAFFSIWVLPAMELRIHQVMAQAKSGSVMETIMPGRFQAVRTGNAERVYYVQKVSRGHQHVQQIFSAERDLKDPKAPWQVIVAKKGEDHFVPKTGDDYFQMDQGEIYKGVPGQNSFHVLNFDQYGIKVGSGALPDFSTDPALMPIGHLLVFARYNSIGMAELQWRLSIPIAVFLLAFVALSLSRIRPRQGRYAKFLPAILIFIVYFNLLMLSRGWLGEAKLSTWIGLWWVHALLLLLGIGFYRSQGSWYFWRKVDVS